MNSRPCLKEREEEAREHEQIWCCASPKMPASVLSKEKKEIPFTVTIILVNGPRVTTYCGPPPTPPPPKKTQQKSNFPQMKAVILKAPELGHCRNSVMYCLHLIKNLTPFHC